MKLFMIRHGQTVANAEGFFAGQSDVKLTEAGRQQALALAPALVNLTFDRVYSSDLSRAVDTAKLALPGCKPEKTELLREFDVGDLTGQPIARCFEQYGPLGNYSPFGGEDRQDVDRRVRAFLNSLEKAPCQQAAAFVHNGVMKSALRLVLGETVDVTAVRNDNCNVAVFSYDGKRWRLLAWNWAGWI